MMQAARWHGRMDVRVEEIPIPRPAANELLLAVSWCGICGTDVHEYQDGPILIPVSEANRLTGRKAPIVLGHEFSGVVTEVGAEVRGFAVGDRVVPDIALFCGDCYYCRRHDYAQCAIWAAIGFHADGGLAEYACVPAGVCRHLPAEISAEEGALVETTEVGVRAVRRAGVRLGDTVAVIGAGAVGLIICQVARAAGAAKVILLGHRSERLAIGRGVGVDAALDTTDDEWRVTVGDLTDGLGADVAFECGGSPDAVNMSIDVTKKGGRVHLVGVSAGLTPVDTLAIVLGERQVTGTIQHHFDEDLPAALHLLATRAVDVSPLISRRIHLDRLVDDGLVPLASHSSDIKVLVSTGLCG